MSRDWENLFWNQALDQIAYFAYLQDMSDQAAKGRIRWWGPKLRGWVAHQMGQSMAGNPNDPRDDAWNLWREGWFAANRGEEATDGEDVN